MLRILHRRISPPISPKFRRSNLAANEANRRALAAHLHEPFSNRRKRRQRRFCYSWQNRIFVSVGIFCLESSRVHKLYDKADKLSREVIGAAMEVHRHKGPWIDRVHLRALPVAR